MEHFLTLKDCTEEEITELLDLADQLKYETRHGIDHPRLKGKAIGLLFEKSSTRTRVSFEVGVSQLGAQPLFLSSADLQIGRGEPVQDTARVLSRYLDGIMIRTFEQKEIEDLAKYGSIPVINGLSDLYHPCQVLADLMTIREHYSKLDGLKLAYIGDGDNMANSLIIGGLKSGMDVSVATPEGYEPDESVLQWAEAYPNFHLCHDPKEALKEADVVYTDTWASMGLEDEKEQRIRDFKGFTLDDELMKEAKENAIVMHCLPAYRGQEISEEVFEKHADTIFEEAENRLHAQKAVMVSLYQDR